MSRLRANQITNENANGAPNFPHGLTVTGVVTATTSATTMSQIVVGSAVTANSQGIDVTGIVTATSFKGDGSSLTGIDATQIATGNTKVQTVASRVDTKVDNVGVLTVTSSGVNVTGIVTANTLAIPGTVIRKSYYPIGRGTFSQTTFPNDDTVPQITEGAEAATQAYTPSTANCDLIITVFAGIKESGNVSNNHAMGLFVSGTNDALQVVSGYTTGNSGGSVHSDNFIIIYKMPSWGTFQKTFSIRVHGANSINYQNANGGAEAKFGEAASKTCLLYTSPSPRDRG